MTYDDVEEPFEFAFYFGAEWLQFHHIRAQAQPA